MSTATTYRRNITKSRSGLYTLTLIDKVTRLRVSGFGWELPERARTEDEPRLAAKLAEEVARCRRLRDDQQKIANAAAVAMSEDA